MLKRAGVDSIVHQRSIDWHFDCWSSTLIGYRRTTMKRLHWRTLIRVCLRSTLGLLPNSRLGGLFLQPHMNERVHIRCCCYASKRPTANGNVRQMRAYAAATNIASSVCLSTHFSSTSFISLSLKHFSFSSHSVPALLHIICVHTLTRITRSLARIFGAGQNIRDHILSLSYAHHTALQHASFDFGFWYVSRLVGVCVFLLLLRLARSLGH